MKIAFIGSGNVAEALALRMKSCGHEIVGIWSRYSEKAELLAKKVTSKSLQKLIEIPSETEVCIISVKDDSIAQIVSELQIENMLLCHTSGFTEMNVLENAANRIGVFYPLQTFTLGRTPDFNEIPFCIEANSKSDEQILIKLAESIGKKAVKMNSEKRKKLHLAAVFACNFSNLSVILADEITKNEGLDRDLLLPLMKETFDKIIEFPAMQNQTGPARRGDTELMKQHLEMLNQDSEKAEIYKLLSEAIMKRYSS